MEGRRKQKHDSGIKEMVVIAVIVAVAALVLYVAGIGCPIKFLTGFRALVAGSRARGSRCSKATCSSPWHIIRSFGQFP